MSTHEKILEMLAERWIDGGGGRNTIRKRDLPAHAYDVCPSVFVQALPTDAKPGDVGVQFIGTCHAHRRFNMGCFPHQLAWHVVAPTGETYFITRWAQWDKHSVPLFREFCEKVGRACGQLMPDRTIEVGGRMFSFFDCKLIHIDDIKPRQPTIKKTGAAARNVVAAARKLLRSKKDAFEEVEFEEFRNDSAAHDQDLHEQLQKRFTKWFQALEKKLTAEFGPPVENGDDDSRNVPLNGVFRFAVWKVNTRQLFLAAHHEDVELPYALMLGTTRGKTRSAR